MDKLRENYFDILELPESLNVNASDIRKAYYRLSRQHHPDHFSGGSEAERNKAILQSELINQAYKVLSDDNLRMKHILDIYGMLAENEQVSLPREFLLEMMELNESFEELDLTDPVVRADVEEVVESVEEDLVEEVSPWLKKFEDGQRDKQVMEGIRDYYLKSKYLLRIKENMANFADPNRNL